MPKQVYFEVESKAVSIYTTIVNHHDKDAGCKCVNLVSIKGKYYLIFQLTKNFTFSRKTYQNRQIKKKQDFRLCSHGYIKDIKYFDDDGNLEGCNVICDVFYTIMAKLDFHRENNLICKELLWIVKVKNEENNIKDAIKIAICHYTDRCKLLGNFQNKNVYYLAFTSQGSGPIGCLLKKGYKVGMHPECETDDIEVNNYGKKVFTKLDPAIPVEMVMTYEEMCEYSYDLYESNFDDIDTELHEEHM